MIVKKTKKTTKIDVIVKSEELILDIDVQAILKKGFLKESIKIQIIKEQMLLIDKIILHI